MLYNTCLQNVLCILYMRDCNCYSKCKDGYYVKKLYILYYIKYIMNLAFYTYFYGSDNNKAFKIPDLPSLKYNCYYYTNNKSMLENLKNTKWIAIYDDKPTNDDLIESSMVGKFIKSSPHEYKELKDYSYLCFLDSKIKAYENIIEEFIQKYFIEQNYALIMKEHWYINSSALNRDVSVWDEYKESMFQKRYVLESDKYKSYINNQIKNGLKENTKDHCATGIIIRNMKHEKINEINNIWYQHIQECGIQCQISFFFVKQLFEEYILSSNSLPIF